MAVGEYPSLKAMPSVKKLSRTAQSLNDETDRLNDAVALVAERLKPLNLGVTSWLRVSTHEVGPYWTIEEIGYAKVKGKWGIALKKATGDESGDDPEDETLWPFNEAPRELRIRAALLLPKLIDKLHTDAEEMVASVAKNTLQLQELAAALCTGESVAKGTK